MGAQEGHFSLWGPRLPAGWQHRSRGSPLWGVSPKAGKHWSKSAQSQRRGCGLCPCTSEALADVSEFLSCYFSVFSTCSLGAGAGLYLTHGSPKRNLLVRSWACFSCSSPAWGKELVPLPPSVALGHPCHPGPPESSSVCPLGGDGAECLGGGGALCLLRLWARGRPEEASGQVPLTPCAHEASLTLMGPGRSCLQRLLFP